MAKGRILRLRGLPWSAREEDVRSFLDGHAPLDVFVRRRGEKSTGEAFVEFGSPEEAAAAQADRNHKDLGQRYIEIFSTDAESMKALRGEAEETDTGWVLRLRGLPFSATAEDVLQFFGGIEVSGGVEGVVFTWGRDGRPLGEAYVEFPSEELQQEALLRDRDKIGQRYIELFRATKADMSARSASSRLSEAGGPDDWMLYGGRSRGRGRASDAGEAEYGMPFQQLQGVPGQPVVMDGSMLRLRGLPYSASTDDVIQFFEDFDVRPEAVQIMMRIGREGQPQGTGMAYVQFASPAEAEAARNEKHRKSMGSRYIECLPLYSHGPLHQPGLPGTMGLHSAPRGIPFIPRPIGPLAAPLPGPVMPPPPAGTPPVMQGIFQYDGGARGVPGGRGAGRIPYGPGRGPPQMIPIGVQGHQPFPGRPVLPGPAGTQQMHGSGGRGGSWRGSRAASPGPVPLQQGMSAASPQGPQLSPAEFQQQQQQMLMQHQQFMMHQHLMHQHQAMSQLRHPGWALSPMGGAFASYGPPLRPQLPLQRPHQQMQQGSYPPGDGPSPLGGFGPGQSQLSAPAGEAEDEVSSSTGPLLQGGAGSARGGVPSSPRHPAAAAHAFPLSPGQPGGGSPSSSLQSELQSLALGSRSQSTASRAASGPTGGVPVAGLHSSGVPLSPQNAQVPPLAGPHD